MRPEIYYTIYDWMRKDLELKNGRLLAFAYLYAVATTYSRVAVKMSPKEVAEHSGMTERNARSVLKSLYRDNLLKQQIIRENGLMYVYWVDRADISDRVFKFNK